MEEFGAKVYKLAMNSAVYFELGDSRYEWIHSGEFVKREDYEKVVKAYLEFFESVMDSCKATGLHLEDI